LTIHTRVLTLLAALLLGGGLLAACGGDDGMDEDTDAQEVLDRTFDGSASIDSGVLEVSLDASAPGEDGGAVSASLNGPFQSGETDSDLPTFQFGAVATGEGGGETFDFEGGLTLTSDGAWVAYDGEDYQVDDASFQFFSQMYSQAAEQANGEEQTTFEQFGIDPRGWVSNPTNDGTEDIDGVEVVRVSGDVDVSQILRDSQALSAQAAELSDEIDPDDLGQLEELVSEASIDVFTGADDEILRRLALTLSLEDGNGEGDAPESARVQFVLGFSEVNEDQEITPPEDAQPLSELPGLDGLGDLGALGSGGAFPEPGQGQGGGGQGGGQGGGGQGDELPGGLNPEYLDCLEAAGADPEAAQACAELL
jgi:hypothetical protein